MKIQTTLVVVKRSALERISSQQELERQNVSYESLHRTARQHAAAIEAVKKALLERSIKVDVVKRIGLPRYKRSPNDYDLVVTVGGDGTMLNASHFITSAPMLGVNSSPETSIGVLCGAYAETFPEALDSVRSGRMKPLHLQRVQAYMDEKPLGPPALNEILFAHKVPAATSRYTLTFRNRCETHKSSGVWVATAAGSTAVAQAAGASVLPIRSKKIHFVVRELYPDKSSNRLKRGTLNPGEALELCSTTIDGALYIDGQPKPYDVPFGKTVTFRLSPHPVTLFGYDRNQRKRLAANMKNSIKNK